MNPKIEKLTKEIEKTREKIAELQDRLRDLERQKTEAENTEYVAIIRSLNLSPQELTAFVRSRQANPARDYTPQKQEDAGNEE